MRSRALTRFIGRCLAVIASFSAWVPAASAGWVSFSAAGTGSGDYFTRYGLVHFFGQATLNIGYEYDPTIHLSASPSRPRS